VKYNWVINVKEKQIILRRVMRGTMWEKKQRAVCPMFKLTSGIRLVSDLIYTVCLSFIAVTFNLNGI